jgi:hypothetical protein
MVLCIGAFSFGAAHLFTGRTRGGLVLAAAGGVGAGLVRPHITLALALALVVGLLLRRGDRSGDGSPLGRASLLAVAVVGGLLALRQVETFFDLSGEENVTDALQYAARQTSTGGSSFEGDVATNPLSLPSAVLTVLFRPLPFEATNLQSLAASIEATLLLCLFLASAKPIARHLARLHREPYLAYCVTYVLLFSAAFSSFNNFGILTRQRTQVLPLVLVLLALGAAGRSREHRLTAASRAADH